MNEKTINIQVKYIKKSSKWRHLEFSLKINLLFKFEGTLLTDMVQAVTTN